MSAERPITEELPALASQVGFDGVWVVDLEGRLLDVDDGYSRRSGYARAELLELGIDGLEAGESGLTLRPRISKVRVSGYDAFYSQHRTKNGEVWPVQIRAVYSPLKGGRLYAFVQDLWARGLEAALAATRARLRALAANGRSEQLIQVALDDAELHTGSAIGFFHFVEADQQSLRLTAWSTNTVGKLCQAAGLGSHYAISEAGVWVEAFHRREPVIHDDYANMPNKRGLPEGHAPVLRELVVPVVRDDRVVALLGVGNKPQPYEQRDIDLVSAIASEITSTVARHQAEEAQRRERTFAKQVLDSLDAYMAVLDGAGTIMVVNDAWRRQAIELGDPERLCEGVNYLDVCRDAESDGSLEATVREQIERVLAGSLSSFEREYSCETEGDSRWFRLRVIPLVGSPGVVVAHEDRTRERDQRLALQASEERYRALAETTYDWIWETDAQGRYTYVSPKVRDLLGLEPTEVLGHTPFELMEPSEAARVHALFAEHARSGAPIRRLLNANRHLDGHTVMLETSGQPILDDHGGLLGYRGVDRDVTIRWSAERRLALQARVSRILAAAEGFAAAAPRLLEALCEADGWDFGGVWERDRSVEGLRCTAAHCRTPELESLCHATREALCAAGQSLPGRSFAERSLYMASGELNEGLLRPTARQAGMRIALAVPITHGEECLGVVELLGREGRLPELAQRELLQNLGQQLGQYLARQRAAEELRRVVEHGSAVIYTMRPQGAWLVPSWISPTIERLTGYGSHEVDEGWLARQLHPDDRERWRVDAVVDDAQPAVFRLRHRDGSWIWVLDERTVHRDTQGAVSEIIGAWSDISDRVELETRLRQSQKLEAIGRLAGGVAHDFNNMLMVINGACEMLLETADGENRAALTDMREAGERATALTRQLLAFSRRQVLEPRVLDLNDTLRGLQKMLRRLIGEDIAITLLLADDLPRVRVDPGQLEQVVLNLAVNARDAMPTGGDLSITSEMVRLHDPLPGFDEEFRPGRYARLSVRDGGCGMAPDVLSRIFEPFFTTKPKGQGTGLGLATVFGIIRQSGGQVLAESVIGQGSVFEVYLPEHLGRDTSEVEADAIATQRGGAETILLVEDESSVRDLVRRALEIKGYRVIVARGGEEALTLAHDNHFDMLLTDVVMPRLSGPQLVERLRGEQPRLRVLFMSGYSEELVRRHGAAGHVLLQKPFTLHELGSRVRQVLDAPENAAVASEPS